MRRWLWTLPIALALVACREPEDDGVGGSSSASTTGSGGAGGVPLPDPVALSVVNWNLQNFVNHLIDDPEATQEQIDSGWATHRQNVGAVLRSLDADLLVLQEVEHQGVLDELNQLELDGRYQQVHVIDANDPRGIDVGVMSKVALDKLVTHKDDSFTLEGTTSPGYRYARDCLEVHLVHNGRPIVLLGVHYRSKNAPDDPDKRLAEAQRTRAIADAITQGAPATALLILGDFNDVPGSPPYEWTLGSAPDRYQNAADHVPEAERWTFDYNGTLELVDQQMANPRMAELLATASVSIPQSPEVSAASDHNPIKATYMVQ
jgi:endonuclease/exonuclease/phosphatase family metal-dependent hydrolase